MNAVMWMQYGRTECIKNTLNPDFVTKFNVDYYFQESQTLKFELWASHTVIKLTQFRRPTKQ